MANYSLLRNAPITEALIDIRIKTREGFSVESFETLYEAISSQYPEKKARHKFEGKLELKMGEAPLSSGTATVEGYLFTSADHKQVFQARVDGFTYNRLRPYDKWETFRDAAFKLWKLYRNIVSPEIIRVALRYINKFDIPFFPDLCWTLVSI